jgi:hypothetical protein
VAGDSWLEKYGGRKVKALGSFSIRCRLSCLFSYRIRHTMLSATSSTVNGPSRTPLGPEMDFADERAADPMKTAGVRKFRWGV